MSEASTPSKVGKLAMFKGKHDTRSDGPTPLMQSVRFELQIVANMTPRQGGPLLNRYEGTDSGMEQLSAGTLVRFNNNARVELTERDEQAIGYVGKVLPLQSAWASETRYFTQTKGYFTVDEVIKAVEELERTGASEKPRLPPHMVRSI